LNTSEWINAASFVPLLDDRRFQNLTGDGLVVLVDVVEEEDVAQNFDDRQNDSNGSDNDSDKRFILFSQNL
jgi:hypothetical protein